MSKPNLVIAELHYPMGSVQYRFRIIEKVHTIDGERDRITNEVFPTLEEAMAFVYGTKEKPE